LAQGHITLGPIATVLGLAFKLRDPDHLIGKSRRYRHHGGAGADRFARRRDRPPPSAGLHVFQNGLTRGRDVFIPIDNVIGGVDQVGKG
jgi:acyl-CoA dehydrogenase